MYSYQEITGLKVEATVGVRNNKVAVTNFIRKENLQAFNAQAAMAFTLAHSSAKVNKVPFRLGKVLSLGGRLRKLGGDNELP